MRSIINRNSKIGRAFLPLLLLAFSFQSVGLAQSATSAVATQAALISEFNVNGLKVIFKRRPNSQTVSAGLFLRGGARNITTENAGIESFALNVAVEGSQKFPRDILRREISRTGSNVSAGASYDHSLLALATTRDNFDRSWDIFTDIAINPAFAATDIELTREKILTGLRNAADDPDGNLQELIKKTVNAKTPYENSPDGTLQTVTRLKADELRAFHKKSMQTSRLLLVIVGDLDAADLEKRIAASFGKLPRGVYQEPIVAGFDFSRSTLDVTPRNLPTNYIQGVFDAPSMKNPDYYAMRVATSLLRERVFEEVRNKRNLSYAPSADMGNLAINSGNIYVTAVDANRAVSVMLGEIKSLQTTPVDARDISGVTGQFLTNYFLGQETNGAQAAELARYELNGGGWRNAPEFLDRVKKVTPADIQRVSQKYMKNIRFVVLGKPESIDRQIFLPN